MQSTACLEELGAATKIMQGETGVQGPSGHWPQRFGGSLLAAPVELGKRLLVVGVSLHQLVRDVDWDLSC